MCLSQITTMSSVVVALQVVATMDSKGSYTLTITDERVATGDWVFETVLTFDAEPGKKITITTDKKKVKLSSHSTRIKATITASKRPETTEDLVSLEIPLDPKSQ
jgi:hypothetical protein